MSLIAESLKDAIEKLRARREELAAELEAIDGTITTLEQLLGG